MWYGCYEVPGWKRRPESGTRTGRRILGRPNPGRKEPSPSELKNKSIARKSIVAARNIRKGESFTEENLTIKRPGTGISPMGLDEVIGQRASKDYKQDDLI